MRGYDRPQSDDADLGEPRAASTGQPSDQADQGAGRGGTQRTLAAVRADVQRSGPALDSAGAVAESLAVDGAVHGAQRADVLRAVGLQPFVPLVPGSELGRAELRPLDL